MIKKTLFSILILFFSFSTYAEQIKTIPNNIDIEELEDLFEAKFDYTKHNLNHIISDLNEIIKEESNLSYMESAWNGDDPCEAACSDPGLQYEKSELISSLWDNFKSNYFNLVSLNYVK